MDVGMAQKKKNKMFFAKKVCDCFCAKNEKFLG